MNELAINFLKNELERKEKAVRLSKQKDDRLKTPIEQWQYGHDCGQVALIDFLLKHFQDDIKG